MVCKGYLIVGEGMQFVEDMRQSVEEDMVY